MCVGCLWYILHCIIFILMQKSTRYAFGTGALYCISAALMTELESYLRSVRAGCTYMPIGPCWLTCEHCGRLQLPLSSWPRGAEAFMSTGDHLRLTDDMTVGALIGNTSNGVYHFM